MLTPDPDFLMKNGGVVGTVVPRNSHHVIRARVFSTIKKDSITYIPPFFHQELRKPPLSGPSPCAKVTIVRSDKVSVIAQFLNQTPMECTIVRTNTDQDEFKFEREMWEQNNAARASLTAVIVPLLRAWVDTCVLNDKLPESFQLEVFKATGMKGGNRSHGGELAINVSTGLNESGVNSIDVDVLHPHPFPVYQDEYHGSLTLIARGDWEQGGLVCSLVNLLVELLPIYTKGA